MSSYVMSFRQQKDHTPTKKEEKAWMDWFESLGQKVTDFGHRVGRNRALGDAGVGGSVLSGYVVVEADSLDEAESLAGGCPGLAGGGAVEVGETI